MNLSETFQQYLDDNYRLGLKTGNEFGFDKGLLTGIIATAVVGGGLGFGLYKVMENATDQTVSRFKISCPTQQRRYVPYGGIVLTRESTLGNDSPDTITLPGGATYCEAGIFKRKQQGYIEIKDREKITYVIPSRS